MKLLLNLWFCVLHWVIINVPLLDHCTHEYPEYVDTATEEAEKRGFKPLSRPPTN